MPPGRQLGSSDGDASVPSAGRPHQGEAFGTGLGLPAALNFRDLGGLATRRGRSLLRRRFYRSGSPAHLGPAEAQAFDALGLSTVIDLRTSIERAEYGTAVGTKARNLHLPLFEVVRPNWVAPDDQSPDATASRYFEMLSDGTATLVNIVEQLATAQVAPFLIHCAAGRDRTGIVVACLLDLLDIVDESIIKDYALSEGVVDDSGRAHAATMSAFLALVRQHHGSTLELLLAQGVSAETCARVSRYLLT